MRRQIRSLAIVTPFYPPHVGGVERYTKEFATAAAGLGLSVNIVTTGALERPFETTEDSGVRVLRLPAHNLPVLGSEFPICISGWRVAEEFLRCDAILVQTRFFMTTLQAAKAAARSGRQVFVLDHGSGPLRTSPKPLVFASLLYERRATAILRRRAARFLAVSSASAAWLADFGIQNVAILPNGITTPRVMPSRGVDGFARPSVFFAGRLLREKGIAELVNAVELVNRNGLDLKLRIAGSGPLAGYVREGAAASRFLTYLDTLSPEGVRAELARATIFVNPSNYAEGLPTILLEAGAAALPVISTPQGSSDVIRDGDTGWLVPHGEAHAIASRLLEALAQPDEALSRGARLFKRIQSGYSWPSIVRRFLELAALPSEGDERTA